MPYPSSWLA